jgi:hypothetical protein
VSSLFANMNNPGADLRTLSFSALMSGLASLTALEKKKIVPLYQVGWLAGWFNIPCRYCVSCHDLPTRICFQAILKQDLVIDGATVCVRIYLKYRADRTVVYVSIVCIYL